MTKSEGITRPPEAAPQPHQSRALPELINIFGQRIDLVQQVLSRPTINTIVFAGPPGSGKTTLLHEFTDTLRQSQTQFQLHLLGYDHLLDTFSQQHGFPQQLAVSDADRQDKEELATYIDQQVQLQKQLLPPPTPFQRHLLVIELPAIGKTNYTTLESGAVVPYAVADRGQTALLNLAIQNQRQGKESSTLVLFTIADELVYQQAQQIRTLASQSANDEEFIELLNQHTSIHLSHQKINPTNPHQIIDLIQQMAPSNQITDILTEFQEQASNFLEQIEKTKTEQKDKEILEMALNHLFVASGQNLTKDQWLSIVKKVFYAHHLMNQKFKFEPTDFQIAVNQFIPQFSTLAYGLPDYS